jgi:SAM-dependent methyltransferase
MSTVTDWDIVAMAQPDIPQGPAARYTQWQILSAAMRGLRYARHPTEWNGEEPLSILKTDLWTEGVVRHREILDCLLHLAWDKGVFTSEYTTYAMDIAMVTCLKARAADTPGHIMQADVRHLPYKDASFDIVLDPSTSDHVPFHDSLFTREEYCRVLRPGGVLVLLFAHHGGTLTKGAGNDYFVFPVSEVRRHLKTIGFDIKREYAIIVGARVLPVSTGTGNCAFLLSLD